MPSFHELSTADLRQALRLREQIEALQERLHTLLGGSSPTVAARPKAAAPPAAGKRTMSAAGRARIRAAQLARWAKIKSEPTASGKAAKPAAAPKKKGGITAAGRAKLAAAMKARWAAKKKGAPAPNTPAK